jgi:hypothetical protein
LIPDVCNAAVDLDLFVLDAANGDAVRLAAFAIKSACRLENGRVPNLANVAARSEVKQVRP